jgi:hypothetical protein
VLLIRAQASKAAIPSAAAAAAAPAASNPAKSPRRKSIGASAVAAPAAAATTAFERTRAFGGIYSHSAEDADEAKFVTDSFSIYASTNALYPVCCSPVNHAVFFVRR